MILNWRLYKLRAVTLRRKCWECLIVPLTAVWLAILLLSSLSQHSEIHGFLFKCSMMLSVFWRRYPNLLKTGCGQVNNYPFYFNISFLEDNFHWIALVMFSTGVLRNSLDFCKRQRGSRKLNKSQSSWWLSAPEYLMWLGESRLAMLGGWKCCSTGIIPP